MPIRPEFRALYGHDWRTVTRPRILTRAGNKCEQCGKPNGVKVETFTDRAMGLLGNPGLPVMFWRGVASSWRDWSGVRVPLAVAIGKRTYSVRVVLTVAHLNHKAGDDRDDNLKALCQWCHLNYDQLHHHETRSKRKDSGRPLLQERAS